MSAGELNSSNYSEQQKDTTNDFNLNSETSIDDSTGQETGQYSDKTVFDQDLNAHNIPDKLEDNRTQLDYSDSDNQGIQESEKNLTDTEHDPSDSGDTQTQENSKEGGKDITIEEGVIGNDREQVVLETVTKDTTEIGGTEIANTESGTKSEHELITEDTKTSHKDNTIDKSEAKLESELVTEDTEATNTDIANDKTETELEPEVGNSQNKSEVSDSKEETDGVTGQDKQETLQDDQQDQVDREQDDQKATKEEDEYNDDFEEDRENTIVGDQNTELDQQTDEEETVTAEKDEPNIGEKSTESKDDSYLNKESLEPNTVSSEKVIVSSNRETENTEREDENDGNKNDGSVVKQAEESLLLGDDKQNDIFQDQEPGDNKISRGEIDTAKDTVVSNSNTTHESKENVVQDQEHYKADEDTDDFWDIDESDNKKDKEDSTIKQSDIRGETNIVTDENLPSNLLTDTDDKKDNSTMEAPSPDIKRNDEKIPVDNGEYLTGADANDGIENNSDLKDVDRKEDRTTEKEVSNDDLKEPIPPPLEPVPEPEPEPEKKESLLDQLLKRNVEIDGSVESISELENNVTTLLQSMKLVVKHYGEILSQQTLRDFSQDMGKFRGDFQSINDAYRRCGQLATTMNNHLKEMRHATEDVKTTIYRKFQNEDLATWTDIAPEKEAGN